MSIGMVGSASMYLTQLSSAYSGQTATGMMEEIFAETDVDESGGIDSSEFEAMTARLSEISGETVDTEELFATYDEDGDGVLSQTEVSTFMEENRPEGELPPPPPMGMMGGIQGGNFNELFSSLDEDEDESLDATEAATLVDMIAKAANEETDAETLISTYDKDGDGELSESEALAALEGSMPKMPPPMGMENYMMNQESSDDFFSILSAMGSYSPIDFFS